MDIVRIQRVAHVSFIAMEGKIITKTSLERQSYLLLVVVFMSRSRLMDKKPISKQK